MPKKQKKYTCPHCQAELLAFELPDAGGWDQKHHLACFNNDCSYYRRGWEWMLKQYNAKVSYRYRLDPDSGQASPIAVWSETALVDRIVKDAVEPARKAQPKKPAKKLAKPVKKKPQKKAGGRVKPKSRTK